MSLKNCKLERKYRKIFVKNKIVLPKSEDLCYTTMRRNVGAPPQQKGRPSCQQAMPKR
jgi:hypothetical protein